MLTTPEASQPPSIFGDPASPELRLLLPVDFSSYSLRAVRMAIDLLETLPHRLDLLHVDSASTSKQDVTARDPWGRGRLDVFRDRLQDLIPASRAGRIECHVVTGKPVEQVLAYAERTAAAMIIVGCHRKGALRRLVSGCSSREILHRSDRPVWFIPTTCRPEIASLEKVS